MKEIKEFSKKIWDDQVNFQATWWNISMKVWSHMCIKSSWYKIKDIFEKNAISFIDIDSFKKNMIDLELKEEDDLSSLIEKNNLSPLVASIETGFHVLLDTYVIHSHNAYINVLMCMKGSDEIVYKLFGETVDMVDYFSPGLWLFQHLLHKDGYKKVIFLKNHWVIVHGNTGFDELYETLNRVVEKIKNYFCLSDFSVSDTIKRIDAHIFPDSIIIQNDIEIYSVHHYIKKSIDTIGGKIKYLNIDDINYIINMKSETYRKQIYINNEKLW